MELEEIPLFIALALSLFGMASPVWCNLHRAMAIIYIVIISFTQFYFKPPVMELGDLPYLGAVLSGTAGIYLAFIAKIYPKKITIRQGSILFIAFMTILFTFICEVGGRSLGGYLYNNINTEHYFLLEIYTPFMVCSTLIQSLILFNGGFDGCQRLLTRIDMYFNGLNSDMGVSIQDRSIHEKHKNSGEEL